MLKLSANMYHNEIQCLEYNKPTLQGFRLSNGIAKKKQLALERNLLHRKFFTTPPTSLVSSNFLKKNSEVDAPTEKEKIKATYEKLIDSLDFNYFGTLTDRKSKTETKFRNYIYGQSFIKDWFTLRNFQIVEEAKRLLENTKGIHEENYWFEQPNFFTKYNYMSEIINDQASIENIKNYQDKLDYNNETVGDSYYETSISKIAKRYNISRIAIFIEYGSKNGQIHAHFLLKHPNIQDVREHKFKGSTKWTKIPNKKNNLSRFFKEISRIGKAQLELIDYTKAVRNYVTKYVLKDIYLNASNNVLQPLTEQTIAKYKGQYKYNQKSYHYPLYEEKVDNPLFKIEDLTGSKKKPEIKCTFGTFKPFQKSLKLNK